MAIQIPSGLRPGPDLPRWAVLPVPRVMSCSTWCSGQTGDADTPGSGHNCSLCHQNVACQRAAAQQQVSQLWLCQEVHGWCWPRGRWQCPARTKRHLCKAQGGNQQMLGARAPGELAWPHTTFVHPLSVPKPLAPNHRARRKGPARSSKDSDQESLEVE